MKLGPILRSSALSRTNPVKFIRKLSEGYQTVIRLQVIITNPMVCTLCTVSLHPLHRPCTLSLPDCAHPVHSLNRDFTFKRCAHRPQGCAHRAHFSHYLCTDCAHFSHFVCTVCTGKLCTVCTVWAPKCMWDLRLTSLTLSVHWWSQHTHTHTHTHGVRILT